MNETWNPKLPERRPCCAICGERVTAPPFVASKLRKGPTIYAHTECFQKEQKEMEREVVEHEIRH